MKKDDLKAFLILESLILVMVFITYELKEADLKSHNKQLIEDKSDLEVVLNSKSNEIFELELDLRSTKKTLAETANELQQIQESVELMSIEYIGEYKCTAYCCEKYPHICGSGSGRTASGQPIQPDVTVAVADPKLLPYGTVIYIEDVGIRIVQDTGHLGSKQIDVAVDTHEHALHWEGSGKHKVWILKEGEGNDENN